MAIKNKAKVNSTLSNETIANVSNFTISKTQNGITTPICVKIKDIINYKVTITNTGECVITNSTFSDDLDTNLSYVTGSFKINNVAATPTISGQNLLYTIPSIPIGGTTYVEFQAIVL